MQEITPDTFGRFIEIWALHPHEYEYEKKYDRLGLAFCKHFQLKDDDFAVDFNNAKTLDELSELVAARIIIN